MGRKRARENARSIIKHMRKIKFIIISAAVLCVLPLAGHAKEAIGGYALEYDQKYETDTDNNGKNDRTSYYQGDRLVWSAYDEDENGKADLWIRYRDGDTPDLELVDYNSDGDPDKISEFDYQGKREVIYDTVEESSSGIIKLIIFAAIAGLAVYLANKYRKEERIRKWLARAMIRISQIKNKGKDSQTPGGGV